jgi:hypothetical protein
VAYRAHGICLCCILLDDLCSQGGVAPVLFMSVSLVDRIRTSLAAAEAAAAVAGEASCSSKAWRSVLQVGHVRCTGGSLPV